MTSNTPEKQIGTDSAATLYAQGQKTQDMLKALEVLSHIANYSANTDTRTRAIEEVIITIQNSLATLVVNVDQIGDKVIELDVMAQSINSGVNESNASHAKTHASLSGLQITVDTFVGWFTPILDDFRNSAILPTMSRIEGKTDELYNSHQDIRELVEAIKDQVEPTIKMLMDSPVLRMLGVNKNG